MSKIHTLAVGEDDKLTFTDGTTHLTSSGMLREADPPQGTNELRVDLRDFDNKYQFATFGSFKIAGETEKYKLILGAFVNGTADKMFQRQRKKNAKLERDSSLAIEGSGNV
ncbi:hypothetical protein KIL84_021730 [Mauremys mutica]|uniref:Fibrinogen C-terminal domain-containing protein n=1 Tax=Mauremys mutica TaxID=74926 RepID=A0A9D3XGC0_9SAUR|nr:hypothetical protein KIL84_021730 [Mauremys mutica]